MPLRSPTVFLALPLLACSAHAFAARQGGHPTSASFQTLAKPAPRAMASAPATQKTAGHTSAASSAAPASPRPRAPESPAARSTPPAPSSYLSVPIVERARLEVTRGVTYDPAYLTLAYPKGDPAPDRGVCTDVVIRSLRAAGIDLQQRVHEDILARPAAYTTVKRPDASIDHRRVAPMLTYLRTHAEALPKTFDEAAFGTWEPGDIVVWSFKPCPACTPNHVGVVSDRKGPRGLPLVLHNIGPKPSEDDQLDAFTVLGHFRLRVRPTGPG